MEETKRLTRLEILRQRWEARVTLCDIRMTDFSQHLEERKLIEREKLVYETVLKEFVAALELPLRETPVN